MFWYANIGSPIVRQSLWSTLRRCSRLLLTTAWTARVESFLRIAGATVYSQSRVALCSLVHVVLLLQERIAVPLGYTLLDKELLWSNSEQIPLCHWFVADSLGVYYWGYSTYMYRDSRRNRTDHATSTRCRCTSVS